MNVRRSCCGRGGVDATAHPLGVRPLSSRPAAAWLPPGTRLGAERSLLEGKAFQAPFAGRLQLIKGSPPRSSVCSLGRARGHTDSLDMEWPRSAAGSDGWRGALARDGQGAVTAAAALRNDVVLGSQPGYQGAMRLRRSSDSGSQCHALSRSPRTSGKGVKDPLPVAGRVAHCCDGATSDHWLECKTSVFTVHVELKEVLADGTQGGRGGEPE